VSALAVHGVSGWLGVLVAQRLHHVRLRAAVDVQHRSLHVPGGGEHVLHGRRLRDRLHARHARVLLGSMWHPRMRGADSGRLHRDVHAGADLVGMHDLRDRSLHVHPGRVALHDDLRERPSRLVRGTAVTWTPLLEGELADRARAAIAGIAEALRDPPPSWHVGPTLADGTAGLAILYAYLDREDDAATHLECAMDAVGDVPMPPSFHRGFVGVAWAAQHLVPDRDDDAIDDALLAMAPPPADDVCDGLIGIGVYALERAGRARADKPIALLARVVAQLAERAEHGRSGACWRVPEAYLDGETRARFPGGMVNLGLAHGVPGVIAFLAAATCFDIAGARALLDDAVRFTLAHELPPGAHGRFADAVGGSPARLGWCYGDLAVATALAHAARATGNRDWRACAHRLADAAARRVDATGIVDACLCHGAAGLGLMFLRLARVLGSPSLATAATDWYARALAFRRDDPVGGFGPYLAEPDLPLGVASVGVLTGAAGVALALAAAVGTREPTWDRMLLLSHA
jgi:class I lanthipeptide synthase